jgi:LPS export ABC transporter protein LptC
MVSYTDSGDLRAKLFTPLVEHYRTFPKDPYLEMRKGLRIFFYGADKSKPESMLKANYGIKYEKSRRVVIKNDVMVVNINHDTLNTEQLIWDENTRKISSNQFVRIKKPKEIIYGHGFESNEDFTNYRIFKIKGMFKREDGEIQ